MAKMELIWCCWHNTIISWWNYRERVEEIKEIKPIDQWGARFASMAVVKNPDKIPAEVIGACKNFSEAEEAFDKAEEAYDKAEEAYWEARVKAGQACVKAWEAREKAWKAYDNILYKHKDLLNKLHKEEVPHTKWNGEVVVWGK